MNEFFTCTNDIITIYSDLTSHTAYIYITELPIPVLGSMSELHDISLSLLQPETSAKLTLTYEQVKAMDDITVTLIPEKKGVVFKHVEYLVESKVSYRTLTHQGIE